MSEAINVDLIKANHHRKKIERKKAALQPSDSGKDFLGNGAYGHVTRARVSLKDNRSVELAYKETSEGLSANAFRAWVRLRDSGVPVPPTFRLVEHDGKYTGVLMTDLTNGWKDVFITSNPTKGMIIDRVNVVHPETIDNLAALDLQDPEFKDNLEQQITDVASNAAKGHIKFKHSDVISAVYSHTGELNLIISDMDNIQVDSSEPYEALLDNNRKMAERINLPLSEASRIAKELRV